jgi:chemotaxis signal transduction protein
LFERDGRRIGLAIDDVYDAITVEETDLRSVPGSEAADGVLVGVVRRGTDLVAVLDAKALLDRVTMEGEKA